MYYYIVIYSLAVIICLFRNNIFSRYLSCSLLIIMALMCLFRGPNIGSDTIHYLNIYASDYAMSRYQNEFVFYNIIQTAKLFGITPTGCQVIMALLFYVPFVFLVFYKCRWPALTVLLFVISTNRYFFETFNISRQMVAVAISLWVWFFLFENKKILALTLYIIACGFHMSTIFSLPAALLCRKVNFSKPVIYISLLLSLVWAFLLSNPIMLSGMLYYLDDFSFIGINKYEYLDGYRVEMNRSIIGLITLIGPHVLMCLLLLKRAPANLLIKLYFCGVVMLNFVAVLPISYRFALCLTALELFLVPEYLFSGDFMSHQVRSRLNTNKLIRQNSIQVFIYIVLLLFYSLYLFTLPSSLDEYVPYDTY